MHCVLAGGAMIGSAAAEDWTAVVIGTPGAGADSAFADAFHVASALSDGGVWDVALLRGADADVLADAITAVAGQPRVLIYYAGPLRQVGGKTRLNAKFGKSDSRLELESILATLSAAGTESAVVLIENCTAQKTTAAPISVPATLPDQLDVYLAATAQSDGTCPAPDARLSDLLIAAKEAPRQSLQEGLTGAWVGARMPLPTFVFPRTEPKRTMTNGFDIVADDVVTVISDDVVQVAHVIQPVRRSEVVTRVRLQPSEMAGIGRADDAVVVFAAPDALTRAAVPLTPGLPEPSIIVGLIEDVARDGFDTVDENSVDVTGNEISYDDLEARRSLRDQDPELFATLVAEGAFDPPEALLARALQTELQRMGCYFARIDGVWGRGSRSSVARYFAEIDGVEPETLEPETDLFRQIIRLDEITCAAAATAAVTGSGGRTQRASTSSQRSQPRQPARAQPAARQKPAAAATNTRTITKSNALGVFR